MIENFWPFVLFAIVVIMTPGPNPIMLAASGVNFGLRRTLPHMAGVALAIPSMMIAVGLGLGAVFEASPSAQLAVRLLGAAMLLYLAWRIATADARGVDNRKIRAPISFFDAFGFQWVNPKAWALVIGAAATYASPGAPLSETVAMAAIFFAILAPGAVLWTLFGVAIANRLKSAEARRAFNLAMSALLVASIGLFFI